MLPEALHQKAMSLCHDSPTAGHQGTLKTWERIRQEAYWVNMAQDVDRHCRECVTCQKAKLPMPVRSTLTNIPIGRPWQMIAIDILEVPVSTKNNRYLLVIQDYFIKWAEARPLKDQTAVRIKAELVKLFCTYGIPEIVHSDQGRNFESSVVQSTLDAFGVVKSSTTPYHHRVMEWLRGLTARYCSCCEHTWKDRKIGNSIYHWLCMHTELLHTPPLECPHSS